MAPALAPALIGQEAAACALLGFVLGSVRAVFPVRGRAAFLPDMALVGAVLLGLQSYAAALSAGGVLRWYMSSSAFLCAFGAERLLRPALQALEHRRVLGVDRIQMHAVFVQGSLDQISAGHQAFLIGQCHIVMMRDGAQRRMQAAETDHGIDEHVIFAPGSQFHQAFFAPAPVQVRILAAEQVMVAFFCHTYLLHMRQLREQCLQLRDIMSDADRTDAEEIAVMAHHIDRLQADGAACAKQYDSFHRVITTIYKMPKHRKLKMRESSRSSTPPCPGSRWLKSLRP